MSGGAVIAAAAAARRQAIARVLDAFRIAGATSPERAQPLASLGLVAGGPVEVLQTSGVLKAGRSSGEWYLDEAAYVAQRDTPARGRSAKTIVVIAVLVAILLVAIAVLMHGAGTGAS